MAFFRNLLQRFIGSPVQFEFKNIVLFLKFTYT